MQEQPTSLSFNPSVSDRKNMQPQGSPTEDRPPKAIPQFSAPRGVLSTMPNNLSPPSRKRQNSFFPRDDDRHLPQDLPRNARNPARDPCPEPCPGTLVEPTGIEPVTSS